VARDYYRILGVARDADDAAIKRAYRKLARELHPDVTGDDPRATEHFKQVTEAYEVLSDRQRRKSYDMFGTKDAPPPGGEGFPPLDFDGLIDQLFPNRKKKPKPEAGVDVDDSVRVSFDEAYSGCEKILRDKLKVTVPPGVADGTRLRLKGQGTKGEAGGPDGDRYVKVAVDDDARFARDGLDVLVDVVVPLRAALLGGAVLVPLPGVGAQPVSMTIPAGTSGGQVFRLRGKGFLKLGGSVRGDLLCSAQIEVPAVPEAERAAVAALLDRLSPPKKSP
jgi:curved DNA-binding protein